MFLVVDTIVLEESAEVITVSPAVTPDPKGGFIVADAREHQVRSYSPQGKLLRVFGAGTEYPDSINRPSRAFRLQTGDIAVANLEGPLVIVPEGKADSVRYLSVPLRTVIDVQSLGDGHVLLTGTDSAPPSALLFDLETATGRIVHRFFPPPAHLDRGVTTTYAYATVARWGDRLAAAHIFSDTLVLFDLRGRALARARIPIDPFVAPVGPLPDLSTVQDRLRWTSHFTQIVGLFWINEDHIAVQWQKLLDGRTAEYGILLMTTTGARQWAVAPAPRLMAVDGDRFYFKDPSVDVPNRWLVAKARSALAVQ